jgi:hypothetical protein
MTITINPEDVASIAFWSGLLCGLPVWWSVWRFAESVGRLIAAIGRDWEGKQ